MDFYCPILLCRHYLHFKILFTIFPIDKSISIPHFDMFLIIPHGARCHPKRGQGIGDIFSLHLRCSTLFFSPLLILAAAFGLDLLFFPSTFIYFSPCHSHHFFILLYIPLLTILKTWWSYCHQLFLPRRSALHSFEKPNRLWFSIAIKKIMRSHSPANVIKDIQGNQLRHAR